MKNLQKQFIEQLCKSTKVTGNALKVSLALIDKELTQKELCQRYKYKKSAVSMSIKKLLDLGIIEKKKKYNSFIYHSNLNWKDEGLKVLTWNINNRANNSKSMPLFIANEIVNRTADIVILTEFNITEGWESFKDILEENNYKLFYNKWSNNNANEILIAIKKRKEIKFKFEKNILIESDIKEKPDFLEIPIIFEGKVFNIIGNRIRPEKDYTKRRQQLDSLIEHLKDKENVLIMGDFNNSKICGDRNLRYEDVREEYHFTQRGEVSDLYDTYNYHILKDAFKDNDFTLYTPKEGYSWVGMGNYKYQQDHIVTKGLYLDESYYDWDFVKFHNGYKNLHEGDYKSDEPGLPDHAILTSVIVIKE